MAQKSYLKKSKKMTAFGCLSDYAVTCQPKALFQRRMMPILGTHPAPYYLINSPMVVVRLNIMVVAPVWG